MSIRRLHFQLLLEPMGQIEPDFAQIILGEKGDSKFD
jgi:hypothetical protein